MCPCKTTCRQKSNSMYSINTKQISSLFYQKVTCSCHDMAEKIVYLVLNTMRSPFWAKQINDIMFIQDLITWHHRLHYNVTIENFLKKHFTECVNPLIVIFIGFFLLQTSKSPIFIKGFVYQCHSGLENMNVTTFLMTSQQRLSRIV